jgi:hypothetical protein
MTDDRRPVVTVTSDPAAQAPHTASAVMQRYATLMASPGLLPPAGACTLQDHADRAMGEVGPLPEECPGDPSASVAVCPPGGCAACCLGFTQAVRQVVAASGGK